MPRPIRVHFAGARYHVINRGNYRQDLFNLHRSGEVFEQTLFEACTRFGWELSAFVVMSNHYHLALHTPEPNLSEGMQWLQSVFANRFNRFVKTPGHVFQGRYKALLVEAGAPLLRVVNYIHLNPVRAGLCTIEELSEHRLSSFPKWLREDAPKCLVCEDWLEQCGGLKRTPVGLNRYQKLLALAQEGQTKHREKLSRELCRGWYIGTREGKQRVLEAWEDRTSNAGAASLRRDMDAAQQFLQRCLRESGHTEVDLAKSRKGAPWKVDIARRLRERFTVSNGWLALHLKMGHPCSVSRLLNRNF